MQFWSWQSPYKTLNSNLYAWKGEFYSMWTISQLRKTKTKNLVYSVSQDLFRPQCLLLPTLFRPPISCWSPLGLPFCTSFCLWALHTTSPLNYALCAVYSSSHPLISSLGYLLLVLPVSAGDDTSPKSLPSDLPRLGLDTSKAFHTQPFCSIFNIICVHFMNVE